MNIMSKHRRSKNSRKRYIAKRRCWRFTNYEKNKGYRIVIKLTAAIKTIIGASINRAGTPISGCSSTHSQVVLNGSALSKTGIIFSTLLLFNSTVNADFFSDAFDWAIDNPEWSVPIGIIGAPIALATLPMVVSYALFPLATQGYQ
jgi:hypothetical protein